MPFITYNRDIPDTPNNPSNDQPDMQVNTNSTDDLINVEHYSFNQNEGGKHKYIRMPDDVNPGGVTGASELLLYNGLDAVHNFFFVPPNTAVPGGAIQLTRNEAPVAANNGYSWMPGGILVQWGRNTAVSGGSFASGAAFGTITFAALNIAFTTSCFTVFTIPFYTVAQPNGAGSVNVDNASLSSTSFNWRFNSNSGSYTGFYWVAIGR